jgi:NAD(P)H-dependent flavin oxidoreductase YrpB (nitropropane dioxygenase family)
MVWASGWRLASAVSNAGGLGLIGAGSMYPEVLKEHISKCQTATGRPFGVNIPLLYPDIDELMQIVTEMGVKIVFTSAGNPKTWTSFLIIFVAAGSSDNTVLLGMHDERAVDALSAVHQRLFEHQEMAVE